MFLSPQWTACCKFSSLLLFHMNSIYICTLDNAYLSCIPFHILDVICYGTLWTLTILFYFFWFYFYFYFYFYFSLKDDKEACADCNHVLYKWHRDGHSNETIPQHQIKGEREKLFLACKSFQRVLGGFIWMLDAVSRKNECWHEPP